MMMMMMMMIIIIVNTDLLNYCHFFLYFFQILKIHYGHSEVSLVNNHTQKQSTTIKLSNKK